MSRLRLIIRRVSMLLVVMMVAGFLGSDIIAAAGWDWKAFLKTLQEKVQSRTQNDEIRSYVEFVNVHKDGLKVTTGTRYRSSLNRKIENQWCYASFLERKPGNPGYLLELAVIDEGEQDPSTVFSDATLRPFGLSQTEAKKLISTHCRFK